jgi:hypothetical protein
VVNKKQDIMPLPHFGIEDWRRAIWPWRHDKLRTPHEWYQLYKDEEIEYREYLSILLYKLVLSLNQFEVKNFLLGKDKDSLRTFNKLKFFQGMKNGIGKWEADQTIGRREVFKLSNMAISMADALDKERTRSKSDSPESPRRNCIRGNCRK